VATYTVVEEASPTHADVEAQLEELHIHTVVVAFADLPGVVRGKRIPTAHFLRTLDTGIAFCNAILGWDIQGDLLDGIPWASFQSGYPDFLARPDVRSLRVAPWQDGTAYVFSDLYTEQGEIVEAAPRRVLERVVAAAETAGYRPKVGAELEFYLTDAERRPAFDDVQAYSVEHGSLVEGVVGEIRAALLAAGIEVEAAGLEYGPAQIEITLSFGDAIAVADDALFFKTAVREIARRHGLRATFMAKPWGAESGNGFHVHQSLWSPDGEQNLFAGNDRLALSYVAGLLDSARELQLLAAPTVNSYKRIRPQSFAPTNVSWGLDNRTTATRALLSDGGSSRIEHRAGAADANPYLIIAANIAAGLRGVTRGLVPPAPIVADAGETEAPALPTDLAEAARLFASSQVAGELFGESFHHAYRELARHELAAWESAVTDWERNRYFDLA
jgi:glutamine synthetase